MMFLVHVPAAPLDRAVKRFYCPVGQKPYRCEFVMPSPSMDLKINFGAPVSARSANASDWEAQSGGGWCMGLWDRYHCVRWPTDPDYIGITFRPGGLFTIFGFEAQELGNQIVALDALIGRFAAELRDRLGEVPDATSRFALLEAIFAPRVRNVRDVERVTSALNLLKRSHGTIPVSKLAADSGVSHKHLIHLFNRMAGAPPKTLARLYRLQHLLAAIQEAEPRTWTGIAHEFAYFDQAHFNKDFKRLTGHTPAQYLDRRRRARAENPNYAEHHRLLPLG